MADQIPPWRFAPEEVPWARWAQDHITKLEGKLERLEQSNKMTSKGQSGTITTLGNNIVALEGVVTKLIQPVAEAGQEFGFTLSGSLTEHATIGLVVPQGCTKAFVFASAVGGLENQMPSGWALLRLQLKVGSVTAGPVTTAIEASRTGSLSLSNAVLIENLVEGETISATAQLAFTGAHDNTVARTSAVALFMV